MADDLNDGRLQRKRRKIARKDEALEVQQVECAGQKGTSSPPAYNFLHLASLILEHDLPILFPGSERPRNAYGMIGAGGSFLVFKEERSMNDVTIPPDQIRSLEDKMVLKRTRQHDDRRYARIDSSTSRYLSIMSELHILLDPAVQAHENIIDLHGLTWDFEPEDDGSYSVWPVMGLEAAECSMRSLMDEYNDSEAPLSTRVGYCYNVAVALEFLHARGVAHCDVKLENVLACVTQRSGSVGKLSDFGSALLGVNEDTFIPNGVAGTPPWNAPEYCRPLRGVEIFKVDVYSFGMLLWRFVARSPTLEPLENAGVKEKERLIQNLEELKLSDRLACIAEEEVRHSYENSDELNSVIEVLTKTLVRQAEERCSMTYVCSLLASVVSPAPDSDAKVENYAEPQSQPEDSPIEDIHSGEDYAEKDEDNTSTESVYQILPIPFEPFYNDFARFYEVIEDQSPLVKAQLIKSLEACAHREHESTSAAAESAYQLAMCDVNGFGVQKDLNRAWEWMMKSARLQNPNAQAQAYRLYKISFPDQDLPLETRKEMLEWLQEAVRRGSYEAAEDLQGLDSSLYGMAKHSWEKRFCQIDIDDAPNLTSREYLAILCKKLGAPALEKMVVNERGSRPIHLAASFGNLDLLGELLKQGIDVNSLNARDETALLCACRANEPKAALFLLNFDASIIPAASGESPLHWLIALEGPSLREVAIKLIEAGANLEQQYNTTENNELTFDVYPHGTPLDWAVSKRCLAAIGLLIELGADPFNECSQYSAFTRAASAHDWEVIQILLTSKHAISSKLGALESTGQSILFEAVDCYRPYGRILIHGHDIIQAAIRTFKALLEAGCDPSRVDKDGSSIMHVLPLFFNSDFVKMLLEECQFKKYINARAGESGRTPIYHAIAAGNIEVVKLLIEHGADTYSRALGQTILHLLATIEDEDYSVLCLKALNPSSRTDLDILAESEDTPEGLTAFELAVLRSHLKFADLLLHAGADPTAVKNRDWHFLARLITLPTWDSLQALQYYLDEVECPFIVRKSTSHSVLHVAASMMHYLADNITGEQKFDVLLNMFSCVDQLDAVTTSSDEPEVAPRQTPLHYAAKFGVFYAARKLLLAGANPSIKDDDGHTPLDLARMQLTSLRARIMEHETFRAVTDLQSTVSLLERAQDLKTIRAMESDRTDTQIRTRFSRLGFQTQPPGLG